MHDIYRGKVTKPNYFRRLAKPAQTAAMEDWGEPPYPKWRPTEDCELQSECSV